MGNIKKTVVLLAEDARNSSSAIEETLKKRDDVELLPTARTGTAVLETVKEHKVDLLIIDLVLSEIDGITVLREIKAMPDIHKPTIVLATALSSELIINQAAQLGAVLVMLKPGDPNLIVSRALEVYHDAGKSLVFIYDKPFSRSEVQRIIVSTLREVGVPPQLLGYKYLRTAILTAAQKPQMLHAITTELYPKVAQEHDSTTPKIERSIRHAIETTWNRSNVDTLYELFGYTISSSRGRPTNSEFIARLTDLVLMRCS